MPHLLETEQRVQLLVGQMGDLLDGVHLVGGCVRDLMLGLEPLEIDVAVEGNAVEFANRFAASLGAAAERHERFGTATVDTEFGAFDFASTRRESYEFPGALPSVSPASLEEDLQRRDFTINAIAVSLAPDSFGSVRAVPGAIADLDARVLRSLHRESFVDDPTRVWRLCRYSARLGLSIEPQTEVDARRAVADGALSTVSLARHGAELARSCSHGEPLAVMEACESFGLLDWIGASGFDVERLLRAEECFGDRVDSTLLRVASLFWGTNAGHGKLDEFALSRRLSAAAREAADVGDLPARLAGTTESEIEALLSSHSPELVALCAFDGPLVEVSRWFDGLRNFTPLLTGRDLVEAGVDEGPAIAVGLEAARVLQLDHGCSDQNELLLAAIAAIRSVEDE